MSCHGDVRVPVHQTIEPVEQRTAKSVVFLFMTSWPTTGSLRSLMGELLTLWTRRQFDVELSWVVSLWTGLNTRRVVFARLITFACLAIPAAARFFTSVEMLSVHRHTTTLGITINILSLIVFCFPENSCCCVAIALTSSIHPSVRSSVRPCVCHASAVQLYWKS